MSMLQTNCTIERAAATAAAVGAPMATLILGTLLLLTRP
jgi:hypothetical protein